jgi:opacity protein-like surface antigen
MKKSLLALALMGVIGTASALDVGVEGGYTKGVSNDPNNGLYGLTVGQKFGSFGVEGSLEHSQRDSNEQNRFGGVVSYDVAKVAGVTLAVKAGVAYLDNDKTRDGWQGTLGAGVSYPVTKEVAVTADYRHDADLQHRVSQYNGNTVIAGVKYSF